MRNKSTLNSISFRSECEKLLKEYSEIFFRTSVSDSPKWFENSYDYFLSNKLKLEDYVFLALLSWQDDYEKSWILRVRLQEEVKHDSNKISIALILSSKEAMWNFLLDTNLWHSRDFFGNILTKKRLQRIQKLCKFYRVRPKPAKKVQRHRGYRDKGSLRNIHEYHSFVSYTKEQNELENNRQVHIDTLAFLQAFLE